LSARNAGLVIAAVALGAIVGALVRCTAPREAPPAAGPDGGVAIEREDAAAPRTPQKRRPLPAPFSLAAEPEVRVVLSAIRGAKSVRLRSDGPCEVFAGDAASPKVRAALRDAVVTRTGDGRLRFEPIGETAAPLRFRAPNGVSVDGKRYRGEIQVAAAPVGLEVVNALPMEAYLRGVVAGEMPRTFPAEALAAQAIVARTYALATMAGIREGSPLVLADDVSDQVYGGAALETEETDAAVLGTAGLVVLGDGDPIVAYFHSTCGGHTSDPGPVLSRPTTPFLRGAPCGHCSDSPHYRFSVDVPRDDVRRALAAAGADAESLRAFSLSPGTRDAGGRLVTFSVTSGADGTVRDVSANALRLSLGSRTLKSTRIDTVESVGGGIRFAGGGFGHGCGLCQYGSRGLALAGRDARAILAHYFPGSTVWRAWPAGGSAGAGAR